MDRKAAIESAILRLAPDQFTRDGRPSVAAINDRIEQEGWQITARERDALWVERVSEAKDAGAPAVELVRFPEMIVDPPDSVRALYGDGDIHRALDHPEPAPDGMVRITLTAAMSNPVPLYVHGVGSWSIRVGKTVTLPDEALDALRNSDCTFTQE